MGKKSPSAPVTYIQKKGAPIVYQTYIPDEHFEEGDRDTEELTKEIEQMDKDMAIEGLDSAGMAADNQRIMDRFDANYAASLPDSAEVRKLSKPFKEPDAEGTEKEWDAEPGKRRKNFPRVYAEKKGLKKKRKSKTQDLYAASLPD